MPVCGASGAERCSHHRRPPSASCTAPGSAKRQEARNAELRTKTKADFKQRRAAARKAKAKKP